MIKCICLLKNAFLKKKDRHFYFWLKSKISIVPFDIKIYKTAFTHSSLQKEKNNETLEFLGDAILDSVISEILYNKYPEKKEGFLSQMRMKITNGQMLSKICLEDELEKKLRTDNNLKITEKISENLLEALIGAIYTDKGYKSVKKYVIKKIINPKINLEELENLVFSYKSWVLEWSAIKKVKVEINVEKNNQLFTSKIIVENLGCFQGDGVSKKKSQEDAFQKIYTSINSLL